MHSVTLGSLVADRYRIIREIGFGGMGTVWLAYDEALESRCAVKLIGTNQALNQEFLVRFECEAKCAAQLRGTHVVDVLNRGQWQGKPFIVMEYLEGEDLAMRLDRVGRLDPRTTYRIVAQVSRALMRAHALGIVHRDIKPENIYLVPGDDHEIAKVLDFGVAKHHALRNAFETASGGQFIGTPCYMSPEQASGRAVDWRSDLWALAVITFECLTGELPFQDESVMDLIVSITRGPVPTMTANRPELPQELEAWWQRATARDPRHRFQSAKEFADTLAEAIGVYPIPVSDFPQASAESPALPGAAVTLHVDDSSTSSRLEDRLRPRRHRVSPYPVAAAALAAALGVAAAVWPPTLDEVLAGLGLDAARAVPPLPPIEELRKKTGEPSRAESLSAVSASHSAPDNAPSVRTLQPASVPEPVVLLVSGRPSPAVNARLPAANVPRTAVRKENHWRPLAPPVPEPARSDAGSLVLPGVGRPARPAAAEPSAADPSPPPPGRS